MKEQRQGGFLIARIHQLAGRVFARILKQYQIEINPAQGRIMFVLWREDDISISELSKRTSLEKSTLTSMLDRLEKASHVTRTRSEQDRRTVLIRRTEKDRAWEETYIQASKDMGTLFYAGFSEAEIVEFERYLERLLNNLIAAEGETE